MNNIYGIKYFFFLQLMLIPIPFIAAEKEQKPAEIQKQSAIAAKLASAINAAGDKVSNYLTTQWNKFKNYIVTKASLYGKKQAIEFLKETKPGKFVATTVETTKKGAEAAQKAAAKGATIAGKDIQKYVEYQQVGPFPLEHDKPLISAKPKAPTTWWERLVQKAQIEADLLFKGPDIQYEETQAEKEQKEHAIAEKRNQLIKMIADIEKSLQEKRKELSDEKIRRIEAALTKAQTRLKKYEQNMASLQYAIDEFFDELYRISAQTEEQPARAQQQILQPVQKQPIVQPSTPQPQPTETKKERWWQGWSWSGKGPEKFD